jgi:hypothetical protein
LTQRAKQAGSGGSVDSVLVVDLLDALNLIAAPSLRDRIAMAIGKNLSAFDPGAVLVPALQTFRSRWANRAVEDTAFLFLWQHSIEFLLARSEFPPKAPTDWAQQVKISCDCEDCRILQDFALDPVCQVHRFRVRQDLRAHLHQTIDKYDLDMTHVTERKGSPHTLVCTKTRRSYELHCRQFQGDIANLALLCLQMRPILPKYRKLVSRAQEAVGRTKSWRM